jgi:hypothetical protein
MAQARSTKPAKKIRARRARQRQRERRFDMRSRYVERDLPTRIGVMLIEDPYTDASRIDREGNLDAQAQLQQARHNDGTVAEGAPGWTPPKRPLLTVITALRDDPLGRMFARRQIDSAQYQGGRAYQDLFVAAQLGHIGGMGEGTKIDNFSGLQAINDRQRRAAQLLRRVDLKVALRLGTDGVSMIRSVLTYGKSIEQTAKERGAVVDREVRYFGFQFRRALDIVAMVLGFANSTYREHQRRIAKPATVVTEPNEDPAYRASAADLADSALRSVCAHRTNQKSPRHEKEFVS